MNRKNSGYIAVYLAFIVLGLTVAVIGYVISRGEADPVAPAKSGTAESRKF